MFLQRLFKRFLSKQADSKEDFANPFAHNHLTGMDHGTDDERDEDFDEEFDEECSVISPLLLVILRCSIKHTDVHCMVACCRRDFLVDVGC